MSAYGALPCSLRTTLMRYFDVAKHRQAQLAGADGELDTTYHLPPHHCDCCYNALFCGSEPLLYVDACKSVA